MPFDWGTPAAVPPRRGGRTRRERIARVLGAGCALVAVAAAVPSAWYSQRAYDDAYGLGRYARLLNPTQRAQLAADVKAGERFVGEHRGTAFPSDVRVHLLPDREFLSTLHGAAGDKGRFSSDAQRALGLLGSSADAKAALDAANLVGYYDGFHTVFARGAYLDDRTRSVLVHELTHALDDSYFDLAQLPDNVEGVSDDRADAAIALVEGDATDVQLQWIETQASSPCTVAADLDLPNPPVCDGEDGVLTTSTAEDAVAEFPYWAGARFVRALRQRGGPSTVDAAFRAPPQDTAQILEPALYLSHTGPEEVPPPSGAPVGRRSSLGALAVSVALTDGAVGAYGSGYLLGWAGDTAVSYQRRGRRCLTDRLRLRSPALARAAEKRFGTWARHKPGRSARRSGARELVFTSCG